MNLRNKKQYGPKDTPKPAKIIKKKLVKTKQDMIRFASQDIDLNRIRLYHGRRLPSKNWVIAYMHQLIKDNKCESVKRSHYSNLSGVLPKHWVIYAAEYNIRSLLKFATRKSSTNLLVSILTGLAKGGHVNTFKYYIKQTEFYKQEWNTWNMITTNPIMTSYLQQIEQKAKTYKNSIDILTDCANHK